MFSEFIASPAAVVGTSLALGSIWLVWPGKHRFSISLCREHQRARIDTFLLGVHVELGGYRRPRPARNPEGDDVEVVVRVHLLGFIHVTKRLPRVEMDVRDGTVVLQLWEEWTADVGSPRELDEAEPMPASGAELERDWDDRTARLAAVWRRARFLSLVTGKVWRRLCPSIVIESLRVRLAGGWGNAALTAYTAGMAWAGWTTVLAALRKRGVVWRRAPQLQVRPLYRGVGVHVEVSGEARIRQGWMVLAALLFVYETLRLALADRWTAGARQRRAARQPVEGRA